MSAPAECRWASRSSCPLVRRIAAVAVAAVVGVGDEDCVGVA